MSLIFLRWWNETMCMSGRWSCSYFMGRLTLLNSKPYILHGASGGVTHLASLYCLISSMLPFSSSLADSLMATDARSCPLYIYLNKYFMDAPACLNIDMTVEQPQQIRVVRDNPLIVQLVTPDFFLAPVITSPINGIRILALWGGLAERAPVMVLAWTTTLRAWAIHI